MPLPITKGAASAQGFGEFAKTGGPALYIEDVFSTYLYTGNGSTQTITNNIDLSTKGGLTWIKSRSAATDHKFTDTTRGATKALISNTTGAQTTDVNGLTAFNTTGFSIGTDSVYNTNAATYASWTFRKAAKFFDVVTYTGTGSTTTIAHNLGSTPGCIIVKRTDTTGNWQVYHNGLTSAAYSIQFNLTNAQASATTVWNSTAPTSSVFSVGTDATVNASGGTYVAYIFAHNAGGFGAAGTDNVISCGSFQANSGATITVNLGYEPQWMLTKDITTGGDWELVDTMRGWGVNAASNNTLQPNTNASENVGTSTGGRLTATGAQFYGFGGTNTYIYITIRRGPMKVPTDATKVFSPIARSGTGATGSSTSFGQVTDLVFTKQRGSTQTWAWTDRLRGPTQELTSAATTVETTYANDVTGFDSMTGFLFGSGASGQVNTSGSTYVDMLFKRAPGFFDVVCYTGTGAVQTVSHNLGVAPEMIIVKRRNAASDWAVYNATLGNSAWVKLNSTSIPAGGVSIWNSISPTNYVFSVGAWFEVNGTGSPPYVAYLFASCPGVSKVGSYTGNGSTQTINCGFTGGARFVLIKRTDAVGDWYVYDTARGMTSLTDPYLLLNSTAAETATLGSVTTVTTGFAVNAAILAAINTNTATYIYLAIA